MEMMWTILMILASGLFSAPVMSHSSIRVHCEEIYDLIPSASVDEDTPSLVADVRVSLSLEEGRHMINISWAINVDSTTKYINGIEIDTSQSLLKCEYTPSLAAAINSSLIDETQDKIWFYHREHMFPAHYYHVQACNLPRTPTEFGLACKSARVLAPIEPDPTVRESVTFISWMATPVPDEERSTPLLVPVGGGLLVGLSLLIVGYVIYKLVRCSFAVDYQKMAAGPKVPVLVVYPAESELFQGAVVALAEFLQQHGGCQVSIDMWQQGCVAKLGPMRWLLEEVQAAQRVIIVAPQPLSQSSPQELPFLGASVAPAAAQDLYPLVLNLVASRAKDSMELAKFWVVRFRGTGPLTPELRACRTFCLMKDLNKLCRNLQSRRENNKKMKITSLLMRCATWYSKNSTEKLQAAVQVLQRPQTSVV